MTLTTVLKTIFGAGTSDSAATYPAAGNNRYYEVGLEHPAAVIRQAPANPIRVQRDEILDTHGRLCGYRFAAVLEESGREVPWGEKELGRTLGEAAVQRIAQRRVVVLPVLPSVLASEKLIEVANSNTVLVVDATKIAPADWAQLRDSAERLTARGIKIGLEGLADNALLGDFDRLIEWRFVDLRTTPITSVENLARELSDRRLNLGVSGIESWAERDAMRSWGFGFFLGPFLTTDVVFQNDGAIDPKRLRLMDILNKLREEVDLHDVALSLKLDPGLIIQLLAHVNSPSAGLSQAVVTIEQAVMVFGRERLYRWLTVLLFASGKGRDGDQALLEKALCRGRFMELVGESRLSKPQCDELFLAGLLSHLEPLLKLPMHRIVEKLLLAENVKRLLLRSEGPYAIYLMLTLAAERGQSIAAFAERVDVVAEDLNKRQIAAVEWAIEAMKAS